LLFTLPHSGLLALFGQVGVKVELGCDPNRFVINCGTKRN